jgi:hypothetical protein
VSADAAEELERLPNIGPVTAGWLRAIGISTRQELVVLGAVAAYQQISLAGYPTSRNLLYALHGAITDVPWHRLPAAEKARLRHEAGV